MEKIIQVGEVGSRELLIKIKLEESELGKVLRIEGWITNHWSKSEFMFKFLNDNDLIKFNNRWDKERFKELLEVWSRWSNNDSFPNCVHQIGLEWEPKRVQVLTYKLDLYTIRTIELLDFLDVDHELRNLPQEVGNLDEIPKKFQNLYQINSDFYNTDLLTPDQHPNGLRGKECPICGYKYGFKRLFKKLPDEVVQFVKSL